MINIFREIKWFIQRGRRGFSDMDKWNMHGYLSTVIPKMIRELNIGSSGCPGDLYDATRINDECWKWKEICEEIAQGFEAAGYLDAYRYQKWVDSEKGDGLMTLEIDYVGIVNAKKKMERGLELFKEYYLGLWD